MKMPYLVQRLKFREHPQEKSKGVDKFFSMDYMGSSEFEWGALPKALKAFRATKLLKKPKKIKQYPDGHTVWYVGPESEYVTAREFFFSQLKDPYKIPLKESTWIDAKFGMSRLFRHPERIDTIGWWAIDSTWAIFTEKEYADKWLSCL
jgi:hypothetical protein